MSPRLADLSTFSRLLDEALDLEPAQAEAWIAALPEAHRHLLPQLRAMLAEHQSQGHAGFMSDGPKLEGGAVDDTLARPDDLVGPYRLIREIGRGGMGAVWLAERADGSLKRHVALKLPRLAWGAGLAERMARERAIGALLEHPNIARLYDAGVDSSGRPYLALEYIDGQPLDAWCEAKALGVPERLRLFLQVARAVAYAHGRLVVHRDLKPSNVLVTADGQAHLLDFGIAKLRHEAAPGDLGLTLEQGRVLTPHYASPEQIRGEAITVASDVYSLGVLLYELLTGRISFEEAVATLERIRKRFDERTSHVPEAIRARVDFALASVYLQGGDVERSRVLLASSVPVLRSLVEAPSTHLEAAIYLGMSAMDRGEHEEADRHLREALELAKRVEGNTPYMVFRYSQLARNLSMHRRFEEAEAVLASLPSFAPIWGLTNGDPMFFADVLLLARARVKLDRGDSAAALALLPPDRLDSEDFTYEDRRLLRGAALCALGRSREGLPLMETHTQKLAEDSSAVHPELAQWRAAAGLCALDAGNQRRATELAELARQAFTRQQGVSPYYKAPLLALEKGLVRR